MKQNRKIILGIAIILVIIAGIAIIATKGLNFGLEYQNSQKVELHLGKKVENKDIEKITKEIFGNQEVIIEKIEVYEEDVSVTAAKITEEQKVQLITKINETFGIEIKNEEIKVEDVSNVRGRDIIKPYIVPFMILTLIILVYLMIRFNKLNSLKILAQTILVIVISQALLLSVIAIVRIPVGYITIPLVLFVYIISILAMTIKFENELVKNKVEEIKK